MPLHSELYMHNRDVITRPDWDSNLVPPHYLALVDTNEPSGPAIVGLVNCVEVGTVSRSNKSKWIQNLSLRFLLFTVEMLTDFFQNFPKQIPNKTFMWTVNC